MPLIKAFRQVLSKQILVIEIPFEDPVAWLTGNIVHIGIYTRVETETRKHTHIQGKSQKSEHKQRDRIKKTRRTNFILRLRVASALLGTWVNCGGIPQKSAQRAIRVCGTEKEWKEKRAKKASKRASLGWCESKYKTSSWSGRNSQPGRHGKSRDKDKNSLSFLQFNWIVAARE